eukprot:Pompholyxophrys_sp_v1_NODE_146_length_1540_cov_9.371044.p1 type:complete len:283 gc:universal NODE_146_length_1540_cov_9.371044:1118-270(-)
MEPKKVLPDVAIFLGRIRQIASVFHRVQVEAQLHKIQSEQGWPLKSIPRDRDNATRWNITYEMLTSICENQQAITLFNARHPTVLKEDMLHPLEFIIASQFVAVLSPIAEVTEFLQGKSFVCVSIYYPSIMRIRKKMGLLARVKCGEEWLEEQKLQKVAQSLRRHIREDLEANWANHMSQEDESFLQLCSALDPRMKHLSFLQECDRVDVWEMLHKEIKKPASFVELAANNLNSEPPAKKSKISKFFTDEDELERGMNCFVAPVLEGDAMIDDEILSFHFFS